MAVNAFKGPVLAFEAELRVSVMLEFQISAFPSVHGVTGRALVAEFISMGVLMAIKAIVMLDSDIESVVFFSLPLLMTLVALKFFMLAVELEVRQVMVEFLRIELDDLPDKPRMFFVTFSAGPLVFSVIAYGIFFALLDNLVALVAFFVFDLACEGVAFIAFIDFLYLVSL